MSLWTRRITRLAIAISLVLWMQAIESPSWSATRTISFSNAGSVYSQSYPWSMGLSLTLTVNPSSSVKPSDTRTVTIDPTGSTASNCSLTNSTLTPTLRADSIGVCRVRVTIYGATYQPASSTRDFTFSKANQTLSFAGSTDQSIYAGDYINFVDQLSYSGTGQVTLSSNSSSCSVSGLVVHALNALSNCTISASIVADIAYNSAISSNTVLLRISQFRNQDPITSVQLSSTSKNYPFTQSPLDVKSISGGSGTGSISISSVTNGTALGCAWNSPTLSASTTGTCIVTVTKAGDDFYSSTSGTAVFNFFNSPAFTVIPCSATNGSNESSPAINISGCAPVLKKSDLTPVITQASISTVMGSKVLTISGSNLTGTSSLLIFTPGSPTTGQRVKITSVGDTALTATVSVPMISKIQISTPNGSATITVIG